MKTLRKIIPLLVLAGSMTACTSYTSKPGKMEHLVGTYELSVYKMKRTIDEESEDYDRKAEIGAVAYFSIDSDGYGYYGYKDNETEARLASMFATFTYDEEKPELVKAIDINDGVTHKYEDEKRVGCLDEPDMGFHDGLLKKTLSYTIHSGHMLFQKDRLIPYQYVEYKKISNDTGVDKINALMGTSYSFSRPFEMKALQGCLVYRCNVYDGSEVPNDGKGIYEYAVLDTNSYENGNFKVYYSLKSNPGQQIALAPAAIDVKGHSFTVDFFGRKFHCGSGEGLGTTLNTNYSDYEEGETINSESFTTWWSYDLSLEDTIAQESSWTNYM